MSFNINKESYDIHRELEVSRIINNHSNKIYTNKNYDDMYGYDLIVKDKELDLFLGFIEIEISNYNYLGGKNWYHSFLKRKVNNFDRTFNVFTDELKKHADRTIYIKFNKNLGLKDCICCDMRTISTFQSDYQDKTNSFYKNCVYRTTMDDKRVKVGIDDCIKYIEEYLLKYRYVQDDDIEEGV